VDGHLTVVGSQNWSGDGTQVNRDASLIFDAVDIYNYFNNVFQFDWATLPNRSKPLRSRRLLPIHRSQRRPAWSASLGTPGTRIDRPAAADQPGG
jgi:phosphatidylserine/phosphatidylglycerophosphate/cardiolipin synthase-like enzyme